MPSALVLYAVVLVLAIAQALALFYGYRRRATERSSDAERRDAAPAAEARDETEGDGDTLVCPVCGARNDRFYRFCKQCVADLSTAASVAHEGGSRPTA